MNRYLFFHRIKGPVILLVFGVTALLDTWHILSYGRSWPLYLIALGLLLLAERAAWAQMQPPPEFPGTPGQNQSPGSYQGPPNQDPYDTRRGNWSEASSTALTITPPDLEPPDDLEPRDEGRK